MITLQELLHYLHGYLDCEGFADFGPNGLQVEGKEQVRKIATSVSASLEAIDQAAALGVDALLVHHGLFWNKLTQTIVSSLREKVAALLHHGISLLAYHLPLDAHREVGNNWRAAREIGMTALEPAIEVNGKMVGVQGRVDLSIKELMSKLEHYYGQPARAALGGPDHVSSAILVSGGAHWEIRQALQFNVDCFITGSCDEPIWWVAHEEKIHFLSMGHSATERTGPRALGEHLEAHFGLPATFIEDANPF